MLQYPVQFHLFRDHGRLNPEVPLEEAGDCGANTLLLLGLIKLDKATELSRKQNICWSTKSGKEFTPRYLLNKYLFKDSSKQYEVIECPKEELMIEVQELRPGYGTFLYMEDKTHFGHFTCIYKNEETGEIELADLQTEEIIKNENYDPRLDDYLSQYELFYIPSTVRHAESPVRRSQSSQSSQTSERPLMYSHGSPAKTIPTEREPYRSPEKVHSPTKGYASDIYSVGNSPELKRSRRYSSNENLNTYKSKGYAASENPVRSPLTPLNRGGKRKRRTRRKN
jgi:hypothetical protein